LTKYNGKFAACAGKEESLSHSQNCAAPGSELELQHSIGTRRHPPGPFNFSRLPAGRHNDLRVVIPYRLALDHAAEFLAMIYGE